MENVSAVDAESTGLATRFGDGTHNVLLLSPSLDANAEDACTDLLTVEPPAREDVLYVTLVDSPDERMDAWRARADGARPAKMGFVDVGGATRSSAAASVLGGDPLGDVLVRPVSSPGNLTDLGIKVSEFLSEWSDDGNRTVVCVDSLTTLLQYADLQRAFRFLHVLTGRVRALDAFAHYHLDPDAHDDRTLNTLLTLFDGVAEWDGSGWVVRNR